MAADSAGRGKQGGWRLGLDPAAEETVIGPLCDDLLGVSAVLFLQHLWAAPEDSGGAVAPGMACFTAVVAAVRAVVGRKSQHGSAVTVVSAFKHGELLK